jgi:hypothetical protein
MSLATAFTISLVGAIILTALAYPAIVWIACKTTKPADLPSLCPECGNLDAWGDEGKKCCLTCGAHQPPPRDFLL